ncbi:MAG: acyltransferase domain-containing protein, partial [Gammaproteobacteria bacterium]|nr:acyltransferase domain-containing protein [Gammaproteobacteria bacterium]
PNPNIDFNALNLKLVTEYTRLSRNEYPLRMAVNSFGFGGANAHVLLEEYRAPDNSSQDSGAVATLPPLSPLPPLLLSARNEQALAVLAQRYLNILGKDEAPAYSDLAAAAALQRQHLSHRMAVFGDSPEVVENLLEIAGRGETATGIIKAQKLTEPARLVLVFSGNGSQWLGMGRELLTAEPVFRATVEQVDQLLNSLVDYKLMDELLAEPDESRLHLTEIAQTALFAVQAGIMRLLWERNLQAEAVLGHSAGEVTAAWAAGALSFEQAVRVIHARSSAQGVTRGSGRMAAVGLSADQIGVELERAGLTGRVEISGINSPRSTTLSGPLSDLEDLKRSLKKQGTFLQLLDLDYAFHSRYMDPARHQVLEVLEGLVPAQTRTAFISTVTGTELPGESLDANYWWENIRKPVQFSKAVGLLLDGGKNVFLEISPNPIMQGHLNKCLRDKGSTGRVLATLKQGSEERTRLNEALYSACLIGCTCDWKQWFVHPSNRVELPAYPWQRQRHWYEVTPEGQNLVNRTMDHPLLGYRLKPGDSEWENQIDPKTPGYLADHSVGGAEVFPASAYVELAFAASRAWYGHPTHGVTDLEIRAPLMLDRKHARTVRFKLSPDDGRFTVSSRVRLTDDPWTLNAVGRLTGVVHRSQPEQSDIAASIP